MKNVYCPSSQKEFNQTRVTNCHSNETGKDLTVQLGKLTITKYKLGDYTEKLSKQFTQGIPDGE